MSSVIHKTLLAGCVTLLLPLTLVAQQGRDTVVTPQSREDILLKLEALLQQGDTQEFVSSLEGIKNPFIRVVERAAPVVVEDAAPVAAPREVIMADQVILEAAANSLRPQGALQTAERSLLRTNRGLLRVNDQIRVSVNGREYTVHVHEITAEGYTLRTGDTLYQSSFSRVGRTGEIRIYQPTEEPTETITE